MDSAEVLRIARLARLRLDREEAAALARDLERIVEHVGALAEADPPGNAPAPAPFETDVHREDRAGECLPRDEALANAPDTDGEHFLVPRVVDRDS